MGETQLLWDWGTAYDLFISLEVLHRPADFGVRASWAAGVRARIPLPYRQVLNLGRLLVGMPLPWVHTLPEPKDALAVLWALDRVPPAERLPLLALGSEVPVDLVSRFAGVAERRAWDESDREAVRTALHCTSKDEALGDDEIVQMLDGWARPDEFGEQYLEALRRYHELFFAEEEHRIRPALRAALARAQNLSLRLALPDLIEELSQGLRFAEMPALQSLVLLPSYWITPLVLFASAEAGKALWFFGARPVEDSLMPGASVPEAMLRALDALSDPTRLRILRYLTHEPLTPAELARRLRLRAPTVTHHLKALRLAGLVQLTIGEGDEDRRYAVRADALATTFASLESYLTR